MAFSVTSWAVICSSKSPIGTNSFINSLNRELDKKANFTEIEINLILEKINSLEIDPSQKERLISKFKVCHKRKKTPLKTSNDASAQQLISPQRKKASHKQAAGQEQICPNDAMLIR